MRLVCIRYTVVFGANVTVMVCCVPSAATSVPMNTYGRGAGGAGVGGVGGVGVGGGIGAGGIGSGREGVGGGVGVGVETPVNCWRMGTTVIGVASQLKPHVIALIGGAPANCCGN